jgi:hypothetical protein
MVFALSRPCSLASTLRLTVLEFCILIVLFRSQNILDLLRTKSLLENCGRRHPTVCHASIRTLNGPLKGPVQVGVRSKYQVHRCRDEPGIVGAAIYRAILIDQRSKRSHPNKVMDVVVCQTSWVDSGSRFLNFGPALTTNRGGDCPLAFGLCSPFPWRLGCRRHRCRHRVAQRLVHLSTHPQPV